MHILKSKLLWAVIIIGAIAGVIYYNVSKKPKINFESIAAKKGELIQEVSATGRVKPAESVDLAFEKSGRVAWVGAKIGDKIIAGQVLVKLESGETYSNLLQAQAALGAETAKLDELKKGTRPEEINAARIKVSNAAVSVVDAQNSLEKIKNKADADLKNDYDSAVASLQKSATVGKNSLITLTDLQTNYFNQQNEDATIIQNAKSSAVGAMLGTNDTGSWSRESLSRLNGGAYGAALYAVNNPVSSNIDAALDSLSIALQKVKAALDAVPILYSFSSADKTTLETEKANVDSEILTLNTKKQTIAVQKSTNAENTNTGITNVNTNKNTLANAEADLTIKLSGTLPEQIAAQVSRVESAKANVLNYQAQIAKTIIKTPIAGIVTNQDAKVGEIAPPNTTIVSVISESQFEIETNVPEADIAKINIGNNAKVTLDPYGDEVTFDAVVVKMDPAEKILDGVATYKVTLQFKNKDERVKSGMTANIDIETARISNVIITPARAVVSNDGQKTVRIISRLPNKNESVKDLIKEINVKTGLRGLNGEIEITEGINEGDLVIIFIEE